MTQFFIQLLNASIASSWLIGAVLLARLIIKGRSPRWIACLLWGLVALRLVVPFSVESPLSLVPETPEITLDFSEEAPSETESIPAPPVSEMGNVSRPTEDSSETEESEPSDEPSEEPSLEPSEEPSFEPSEEPSFEPSYSEEPSEAPSEEPSREPSSEPSEEPDKSEEPEESFEESSEEESYDESSEESSEESEESEEESLEETSEESIPAGMMGPTSTPGNPSHGSGISFATTASGIWLAGVLALAGYALVNYLILKKRVLVFVPDERGFRRCEGIDTPFVLGFFRPRIYLPYGLSTASEPYIIAHEKAHIKRMDHLVKPIAYCILALHWFNPLVWIAFVLFCKDIEYACDEKVLKNAAADYRKEYATALLECASKRSFLAACPIAFGEVSVKERVKKTMNYKRPLLWVIIVSVLLCALVAVLFFTAPMNEESAPNTSSEESTSPEETERKTTLELISDIPVGSDLSVIALGYDKDPSDARIIAPDAVAMATEGQLYFILDGEWYKLGSDKAQSVIEKPLIELKKGRKYSTISLAMYSNQAYVAFSYADNRATGKPWLYAESRVGYTNGHVARQMGYTIESTNVPISVFRTDDGEPLIQVGDYVYTPDRRIVESVLTPSGEGAEPYGITIGGVTHTMANPPTIVCQRGGLLTVKENIRKSVVSKDGIKHVMVQEIYHQYDESGTLIAEFKVTDLGCGLELPCRVEIDGVTCKAAALKTVAIGEQVFEDVYSYYIFAGGEGELYALLVYTDGAKLYKITPGMSEVEFTDWAISCDTCGYRSPSRPDESEPDESEPEVSEPDESEPEVSEPEDSEPPVEIVKPEEKETTLEKVLSFDIGIGGIMEYNFMFYDDPSSADVIVYGSAYTDGNGVFYQVADNELIRVNDGAKFPFISGSQFYDIEIMENDFYVLKAGNTGLYSILYHYDVSTGFETPTLIAKYDNLPSGSLGLIDGTPIVFEQGKAYDVDGRLLDESEMPYVIKQSENDSVTVRMENNLLTIYQGESFYCYVPAASGFRTAVAESKRKGSDNTIYSSYDRIGNIKNRFSHTVRYPGVTVSCKLDYTWGNEVYTVNAYTPVRTMIGGQTFENLLQGRVFFDVYGNAYYAAYYLDHCDLYRINMGYSDIQLTDQPEPSDELPPEEELSMELALRFGCGPDYPISLWAYTNGYPEFGELIMEESIFTDGKGNFYKDVYNGILRINDGVKLSKDSVVRGTANGSKYVLSGGDSLWYEDRYLNEDIYILQNENKEVVSRIKVSIEQPYQYQPCEIRYWTNEYSGNYATVRYYRPYTIKVNEVIFENVVEYQIFHGKEGTLYLVMFFAEHGEIYAITGGVTHEAATPATEETDDRNLPILFEIYYEEQDDLRQLLNDPLGDHLGRGYEIPINHKLLYYMEATPVLLSEEFVELATDFAAMEAYLKGQGFSCKVTDIVVFSAETAPVTLMALTEAGNAYFVTAKIDYPTKEQVYAAYSLEDYRNTFLSREVKVVVNGTEMTPKYTVTAYGENTMLPIVQVLQALGGTVEQVDGGVSITLDGKQCFVYFGEHCIMYGDEEWAYGWEVEYHRDELLIPKVELQSIFDVFCPGVEIRVDIANNAVYIERKVRSEKETTMELVDEIPVNDPRSPIFLQYNIGESFYGQIITPTRFLVDLNEDIYCVVGEGLFRLRDSEGFRLIDPNDTGDRSVSSVAVYNGTIYVAYKSFSGQKGELVAYDITGKVLSSAALPAAKYGEYYYLFISEDGKPKVLFGNDIYSHTGQKVGVLNAEADVTYGVTIGGVTHSMTNEPLILSRLGGVSTIREIQEKWYGTDPAKRHRIREEIFYQYDKAGNLVSEFKLTEFSCGKDIPCHVAIGEAVCTSVSLETVTIGENVFEGVYSCRVVPGADGKLYAILIYTDGTRIYRIDPGYSDVEFRDLDAIENPKAECLICKAPAPAEKETTLEKVFTFDIGPNGVMEYNFFFEGDPSKGNIGLPGDFFADGDGNYYFAVGDRLIRLNDGIVLPQRAINNVLDVKICGNTLYMLAGKGVVYQLDISNGFASATLEAEYPVFRYGYDSSGSLIRYGDTVLYQSREGLLYTLDKTLLTGNSAPYQFVTGNEVFVTLDRDTATLLINKNANENISVRAITSAGISITDYTGTNTGRAVDQAIFSTYDLSGKATSRFMMTTVYQSESTWGRVEFHYGDGLKTTIVYRPQDIMVGKKIFEDVLMGRMYCGMDGNFYFVAYHVNRADVYLVNAG